MIVWPSPRGTRYASAARCERTRRTPRAGASRRRPSGVRAARGPAGERRTHLGNVGAQHQHGLAAREVEAEHAGRGEILVAVEPARALVGVEKAAIPVGRVLVVAVRPARARLARRRRAASGRGAVTARHRSGTRVLVMQRVDSRAPRAAAARQASRASAAPRSAPAQEDHAARRGARRALHDRVTPSAAQASSAATARARSDSIAARTVGATTTPRRSDAT